MALHTNFKLFVCLFANFCASFSGENHCTKMNQTGVFVLEYHSILCDFSLAWYTCPDCFGVRVARTKFGTEFGTETG